MLGLDRLREFAQKKNVKQLKDSKRDEIWRCVKKISDERLDFQMQMSIEEYKLQAQGRTNLRGRIQSLLIVLLAPLSACWSILFFQELSILQKCCLSLSGMIWLYCAGWLFIYVLSVRTKTAFGSVTDWDFLDDDLLSVKRLKFFDVEETIAEIREANRDASRIFNHCLYFSILGFIPCLVTGILNLF